MYYYHHEIGGINMLTKDEKYIEATQSNIGIISEKDQETLRKSIVAIAGCGGMGGQITPQLARWGVGGIKLADFDKFERSNFNRQFQAYEDTIGKSKASVVLNEILRINPNLKYEVYGEGVTLNNAESFVRDADIVIDAIDYTCLPASIALHRAARHEGLYILTSQAIGFGANIFTFSPVGITLEEYVGLENDSSCEEIIKHKIPLECFCPILPLYLEADVIKKAAYGEIAIPNVASAQAIGSGIMAIEVILLLLKKIEPILTPNFISIDIFKREFITSK